MATAIYYLSQLTGKPVLDPHGQPVGLVGDLVVRLGGAFPPVTGLTLRLGGVGRRVGPLATFLDWRQVSSVTSAALGLSSARLDLQRFRRRPGELLLDADLMDQQVIDLHGRKLVRVNDVQLAAAGPGGADLRLAGIDVGERGLLRRLGLDRLAAWLGARTPLKVPDRVIPWESVEPVDLSELPPEQAGEYPGALASRGDGRPGLAGGLRLTHEKLAELHPADVAELVAQLAAPERAAILESLEPETAAETLGELEPEMQAGVLEDLPTEAAVGILAELPPDEAADALAEVSAERADELLGALDAEDARTVRQLMAYPEDVAGGMMTTSYVALDAHLTAQETIDTLRRIAPPAEEIYYLYVVDEGGKLGGVISLRDLIVAPPMARLSELIADRGEVVHVPVEMPRDEVIELVGKYNLLAVPVTDDDGRLVGVITVDDALAAALPEERRRLLGVRL